MSLVGSGAIFHCILERLAKGKCRRRRRWNVNRLLRSRIAPITRLLPLGVEGAKAYQRDLVAVRDGFDDDIESCRNRGGTAQNTHGLGMRQTR